MSCSEHKRTIIHFDIDCFYAQVEMIRNPSLRDKPLGIQQKYLLVTCNYEARKRGVTKLMSLSEARKKCPDLILVKGEDLTHYRNTSYQISDFIQKYTPHVERLGFDENFADVSDMVNDRIEKKNFEHKFSGRVYEFESESQSCSHKKDNVENYDNNDSDSSSVCNCGCLLRLQVGSQIAEGIREGLKRELQITCCAGIAHNKLLSKLVGSIHKPNQQTSILPHLGCQLVSSLPGIRSIPGIGSSSAKRLKARGIDSIWTLQQTHLSILEEEFGKSMAETFSKLCFGIDNSAVLPFSLPQTISDEDSFKCCNEIEDAKSRIGELIFSLLQRLKDDTRTPSTLRLTVRGKDYVRNCRQCPISTNVFKGFGQEDGLEMVRLRLMPLLMNLFHKLVDVSKPFHLTLINVCFAKFIDANSKQNTLDSFFASRSSHAITSQQNPIRKCSVENMVEEEEFDEKVLRDEMKHFNTNLEFKSEIQNVIDKDVNSSKSENKLNMQAYKDSSPISDFPIFQSACSSISVKPETDFDPDSTDAEKDLIQPVSILYPEPCPEVNNQTVEVLKKLLPKHIDPCELLLLPENIQNEVLLSFGIKIKISRDGQKHYSLLNKVSTRSQKHVENSFSEQSKNLYHCQRKPLFSPKKRKADNERDVDSVSTPSTKKVATLRLDDSSDVVAKRQRCDNHENTNVETEELSEDQKDCIHKKQDRNSVIDSQSYSLAGSSSIDISTPSDPLSQHIKMPSSDVLLDDNDDLQFKAEFNTSYPSSGSRHFNFTVHEEDVHSKSIQAPSSHATGVKKLTPLSAETQNNDIKGDSVIDTSVSTTTTAGIICRRGERNLKRDNSVDKPTVSCVVQNEFTDKVNSQHSRSSSSSSSSSSINQRELLTMEKQKLSNTNTVPITNSTAIANEHFSSSRPKKCPEGIDPGVFYSLPPNIQGEILAHNAMGTGSLFTKNDHHIQSTANENTDSSFSASRCSLASAGGKSKGKRASSQKGIFDYFKKK